MCCCDKDKSPQFQELEAFIKGLPDKRGELITVLHKAQGIFGYLPEEVQAFVAKKLDIPLAKVYGVVTFYSFFTMVPKGKVVVSVCMGTACYVRGAEEVLAELEKVLGIKAGQVSADGGCVEARVTATTRSIAASTAATIESATVQSCR